ncbi:MAG UNVERIFIED_CONTAM: NAD(P)H-dependent oxidoreductase subunit E [Planctomycetaceae bacterium]
MKKSKRNFPNTPINAPSLCPPCTSSTTHSASVSREAIVEIAQLLELHPSEVHDTMTFYNFFKEEENPLGRHRVWFCRSISCALRGGEELLESVCHRYGVHPGHTTQDGKFTVEFAECLGACEGAPCILVNDVCHMDMTPESTSALIDKL